MSDALDRLVKVGQLKEEPSSPSELSGLFTSGTKRLRDAKNETLSLESRFDLAYNASHALSLCALRRLGYRSESRYLVFQCLPHTLGLENSQWRVLDTAHRKRNLAEYEGHIDVDRALVESLIRMTEEIEKRLAEHFDASDLAVPNTVE